jgi:hypothetical protein
MKTLSTTLESAGWVQKEFSKDLLASTMKLNFFKWMRERLSRIGLSWMVAEIWLPVWYKWNIEQCPNSIARKEQIDNSVWLRSAIFALEEMLKMHAEKITNNDFTSLSYFQELINESPEENVDMECFKQLLSTLQHQIGMRFQEFPRFRNPFRLVDIPGWSQLKSCFWFVSQMS